jgi:putative inorganic carbon (HCO3(-)) transporter
MLILVAILTVLFGVFQYAAFDAFHTLLPLLYANAEIPFIEVWQNQGRVVANWVHPADFGSLLNIVAPIALWSWLNAKKRRIGPLLSFICIGAGVLFTATRTTVVTFCLSTTLFCLLTRARRIAFAIPAVAITILIASTLFTTTSQRFRLSDEGNVTTIQERSLLWLEGVDFLFQHPVIGIGARNFMDQVLVNPDMPTHNVYLEAAAETGVVGFLAFIYLLYRGLRVGWKGTHSRLPLELENLQRAFLCSSLAIMIESLADNDFYVWQVWCLFWLVRGLSAVVASRPHAFLREDQTSRICGR